MSHALRDELLRLAYAHRESARIASDNNYRYESEISAQESLRLANEIDELIKGRGL